MEKLMDILGIIIQDIILPLKILILKMYLNDLVDFL